MIDERDADTRSFIASIRPNWTKVRLRKTFSLEIKESSFSCSSIVFDDDHSFLCAVGSKDVQETHVEYFPLRCRFAPQEVLSKFEFVTLASKGGASELDRKLRWLFETPTLTLTEMVEEFRDGMAPDAKRYQFRFYNGLVISDPYGRGSLRLTAMDNPMPDFVLSGEFAFGREAS
ncbi:hypothetical protein [Methylocella sp.]|uniref:hypothetical protein n=1 Tax=Methylocella sp. TaxID=1978226 RepID=UPI0035AF4194